jgi:hypothetical protein
MLVAFYDLHISPVSFDFLHFLVCAQRKAENKPFHVVIVPGQADGYKPNDHKPISKAEKDWRVHHIFVPLAKSADATITLAPSREFAAGIRAENVFPVGYEIDYPRHHYTLGAALWAFRHGGTPKFQASARAKEHIAKYLGHHDNVVTLTLRKANNDIRNSKFEAWLDFANHLTNHGYHPVFIPDTEDALGHGSGFGYVCRQASVDLDLRLALYDAAVMNCSSSGGPFVANLFDDSRPYLYFMKVHEEAWRVVDGVRHWQPDQKFFEGQSLPPGTQYPLSNLRRRIVWEEESAERLIAEFEASMSQPMEKVA